MDGIVLLATGFPIGIILFVWFVTAEKGVCVSVRIAYTIQSNAVEYLDSETPQ
jgi:hypothetical protein